MIIAVFITSCLEIVIIMVLIKDLTEGEYFIGATGAGGATKLEFPGADAGGAVTGIGGTGMGAVGAEEVADIGGTGIAESAEPCADGMMVIA